MQHSTVMILILIAAAVAGVMLVKHVCKQEAKESFQYSKQTQQELCAEQAQLFKQTPYLEDAAATAYTNCMEQVQAHPGINMPMAYVTAQQQPEIMPAYPVYTNLP
jgi:hypothetical protein